MRRPTSISRTMPLHLSRSLMADMRKNLIQTPAGSKSRAIEQWRAIERKRYTVHGENGARANVRPGKQVGLSGASERNKSSLYVQSQIFSSGEFCHTLKKRVDGQIPGRMDLSIIAPHTRMPKDGRWLWTGLPPDANLSRR